MARKQPPQRKTGINSFWIALIGAFVVGVLVWMVLSFTNNNRISSNTNQDPSSLVAQDEENLSLSKDDLPIRMIPMEKRGKAPDFTLPYLNGDSFSLSSLAGKVILLDFTATWCYYCDLQAPQVNKVVQKFKDSNFQAIAIDCRESKDVVLAKYPKGNKGYPIVLDERGETLSIYGINGFPTYLILDSQGRVAFFQSGYDDNFEMIASNIIQYLLKNEI